MKNALLSLGLALTFTAAPLLAQKAPVYAEIGVGAGQTLFFGDTKATLNTALGGTFSPGIAGNFTAAFYYAPDRWKGLGVGTRFKIAGSGSAKGDGGDDYFFNYYNLGVAVKYHPGGQFNRGFYGRASIGTGQLTTKRANDATRSFTHQFAIGSALIGGIGYAFPLRQSAIGIEAEFEYGSRNGTINTLGDRTLTSGQVGVNVTYSF